MQNGNVNTGALKDRIHFLTQASAGFEIRPKMVFLGSGKLKTMFYDDFEQHEKIEFVDFLYGHIFFLRKEKNIWVRSWIRSLKVHLFWELLICWISLV